MEHVKETSNCVACRRYSISGTDVQQEGHNSTRCKFHQRKAHSVDLHNHYEEMGKNKPVCAKELYSRVLSGQVIK